MLKHALPKPREAPGRGTARRYASLPPPWGSQQTSPRAALQAGPGTPQGLPGPPRPPHRPGPPAALACRRVRVGVPGQCPLWRNRRPHTGEPGRPPDHAQHRGGGGAGAHLRAGEATFCNLGDGQAPVSAPGQGQERHSVPSGHPARVTAAREHGVRAHGGEPAGGPVKLPLACPACTPAPETNGRVLSEFAPWGRHSPSWWKGAQVGWLKPQPHNFLPGPGSGCGAFGLWPEAHAVLGCQRRHLEPRVFGVSGYWVPLGASLWIRAGCGPMGLGSCPPCPVAPGCTPISQALILMVGDGWGADGPGC